MDEKKYQIFISSTYTDLRKERDSIIKTILELYHIPIGMEMFSAEDEDQWEIIRRTIASSDYYILILGLRYGSKSHDNISFTQKEYDYAREKNIPILAFVMKDDSPLEQGRRDDDLREVNAFRKLVLSNNKMAQFWTTKDELTKNVSISLMKQIMQKPGIGWVRGDKAISEELSKELANLSKENRTLRTENERLKQLTPTRKPDIFTTLNGKNQLEIEFTKQEDIHIDFNGHDLPFRVIQYPKTINIDTIPEHLQTYVNTNGYAAVEIYNKSLPTKEKVDQYNIDRQIHFRIKGTAIKADFEFKNRGSIKANEIYADIEFPDFLLIMSDDEIDELDHPESPIPDNPLETAERAYKKNQRLTPVHLGMSHLNAFPNFKIPSQPRSLMPPMSFLKHNKELSSDLDKDNKKLTISIKSILHTRAISNKEYFIIPIRPGEGDIIITTVCEEYSEPIISTIPIVIR